MTRTRGGRRVGGPGGVVDDGGEQRGSTGPARTVLLMRTWSDGEAELVRQILAGSDIPCIVSTSVAHAVFPLSVDGLGEIRILVAPELLQQAREILAEHLRDGLELIDGGLSDGAEPGESSDDGEDPQPRKRTGGA